MTDEYSDHIKLGYDLYKEMRQCSDKFISPISKRQDLGAIVEFGMVIFMAEFFANSFPTTEIREPVLHKFFADIKVMSDSMFSLKKDTMQ